MITKVFEPTEEQQRVIEHTGSAFIAACPGAGKTRVMVERARKLLGCRATGRGIAFLSFTNRRRLRIGGQIASRGAGREIYGQPSRQNGRLLKSLGFFGGTPKTVLSGTIVKRGMQETIRLDPCIPPISRSDPITNTSDCHVCHPYSVICSPTLAPPIDGAVA